MRLPQVLFEKCVATDVEITVEYRAAAEDLRFLGGSNSHDHHFLGVRL